MNEKRIFESSDCWCRAKPEYAHEYHSSDEVEEYDMDCDECMGTGIGYPVDFPCSCCGGTGMVKVRQEDCDYNPDYN